MTRLKDRRAIARITIRIDRLASGNAGDVRPVGEGVSELRIDYGPGYRVYFVRRGNVLVVLLCGGEKNSQKKDIDIARRLAREWKEADNGPLDDTL
jgi:putative addiction module killer protein